MVYGRDYQHYLSGCYQSAYKTLSQLTHLPSWLYGVDLLVYTMFHWALPPSVTKLTTVDPQLNSMVSPRRAGRCGTSCGNAWLFRACSNSALEIWSHNGVVNQSPYSYPYTVVTSGWQTGCCGWKSIFTYDHFGSIQTPLQASLFKGEK